MKVTRVLLAAGVSFLVGGIAVAVATPAAASTPSKQPCTNISCAFHPDGEHVWCVYVPGSKCNLANPYNCESDWC